MESPSRGGATGRALALRQERAAGPEAPAYGVNAASPSIVACASNVLDCRSDLRLPEGICHRHLCQPDASHRCTPKVLRTEPVGLPDGGSFRASPPIVIESGRYTFVLPYSSQRSTVDCKGADLWKIIGARPVGVRELVFQRRFLNAAFCVADGTNVVIDLGRCCSTLLHPPKSSRLASRVYGSGQ
jgi:hypothetical protein